MAGIPLGIQNRDNRLDSCSRNVPLEQEMSQTTLRIEIPTALLQELKRRAAETQLTVRAVILLALSQDGFTVDQEEIRDRRKTVAISPGPVSTENIWEVYQNGTCVCSWRMGLSEFQARTKVENELRQGIVMEARKYVPKEDS